MIPEDKQLLLKDLCARLSYEVKFTLSSRNIYTMKGIDLIVTDEGDWEYAVTAKGINPIEIEYIKPYLRPMSSITEEDMEELNRDVGGDRFIFKDGVISVDENFYHEGHLYSDHEDYVNIIDWLNAHYFDYRGLIEKGLALEAPADMYKTE